MSGDAEPTDVGAVTVSIVRHVAPEHAAQMIAWVRSGSSLAERFPGFLGTGWVRPTDDSEEWHMLYRFSDPSSLAAWESSPQRTWWLGSAQGIVGESLLERRQGSRGGSTSRRRATYRTCDPHRLHRRVGSRESSSG